LVVVGSNPVAVVVDSKPVAVVVDSKPVAVVVDSKPVAEAVAEAVVVGPVGSVAFELGPQGAEGPLLCQLQVKT
jgi:hypothetical protein